MSWVRSKIPRDRLPGFKVNYPQEKPTQFHGAGSWQIPLLPVLLSNVFFTSRKKKLRMKSSNCICIWSPQLKLVCVHLQILDLTKGAWLNELMLRHLPPSPFPLSTWAGIFSLQRLEVLGWVCQQLALLKKLSKFLFLISINIKDSLIVFGWKVSANKEKKWLPEWKNF